MKRQPGLFDMDERLKRLSDIGDQLEAFSMVVDFEVFRSELEAALQYGDGARGDRPPFDPLMMFKIHVIQAHGPLSGSRPKCGGFRPPLLAIDRGRPDRPGSARKA